MVGSFSLFLKETKKEFKIMHSFFKGIQNDWSLFSFSEGDKKGIQNNAFLFHLSEESIKGIQNDWSLFSFSEGDKKRNSK